MSEKLKPLNTMHIPSEQLQKAINEYKSDLKLLYRYEASNRIREYEIQHYKLTGTEKVFESLFGIEFIGKIQNETWNEYSNNN